LGIDPGYATTGFGLIDCLDDRVTAVEFGTITTDKNLPHSERLKQTVEDLKNIIAEFQPDKIVMEELFFSKNVKTALKVAEARGAILYELGRQKQDISEYKPNQVKNSICGNGSAPKIQIQKMVQLLLNLDQLPTPDDAADALAIAICHANHLKQKLNIIQ
jgi:crossover junction endodeoxyribonuclease RuvC